MATFGVQQIFKALLLGQMDIFSSLQQSKDEALVQLPLLDWGLHIALVWLVGLLFGWMLPRPRIQLQSKKMPLKLWLGRVAVLWNATLLLREVWYRFCIPGTFRAILRTIVVSVRKEVGFKEAWRIVCEQARSRRVYRAVATGDSEEADHLQWYVSASDLRRFKEAVGTENDNDWEKMFEKTWEGCSYSAWRRRRPNGRTEYKSVTLAENATCNEFMDFYLDDDVRPKWDGLVSRHELLESAHEAQDRCQVVRWIRSFPFAFISDREYVIARRVFQGDTGELYGITKSIEHPAAPQDTSVVRMHDFYSMWRSRTVPCPSGSGNPACETTLLHYEDFGIPENLARFAVRHGMSGFVSNMIPHMHDFIQARRMRCKPTDFDDQAYGVGSISTFPAGEYAQALCRPDAEIKAGKQGISIFAAKSRKFGYMILATGIALAFSKGAYSVPQESNQGHKTRHHHSHVYKRKHRHIYKGHVFDKVHKLRE